MTRREFLRRSAPFALAIIGLLLGIQLAHRMAEFALCLRELAPWQVFQPSESITGFCLRQHVLFLL